MTKQRRTGSRNGQAAVPRRMVASGTHAHTMRHAHNPHTKPASNNPAAVPAQSAPAVPPARPSDLRFASGSSNLIEPRSKPRLCLHLSCGPARVAAYLPKPRSALVSVRVPAASGTWYCKVHQRRVAQAAISRALRTRLNCRSAGCVPGRAWAAKWRPRRRLPRPTCLP